MAIAHQAINLLQLVGVSNNTNVKILQYIIFQGEKKHSQKAAMVQYIKLLYSQ
jgi:hypothetical protein